MSGFVPRRVAMTRTASATTDMKAATWNNQLISTIGRRSTLRNQIQKRSFGSFLQINYTNAVGNKCEREELAPVRTQGTLQLVKDVAYNVELFKDENTMGFVIKSLQEDIVKLGGAGTDRYCAFGAIGNYVEDIRMPTFTGAAAGCSGARILALERWYTTGWDAIPLSSSSTAGDRTSLVLAVVGNFTTGPKIRIDGEIHACEDVIQNIPQFGNSPNGVAKYGTGAGATPFTLFRYGGSGTFSTSDPDTTFAAGFNNINEKKSIIIFSE